MNRKGKRLGKTALCAVLALSMVLCNSSFMEAKKVSKQESVYVNAEADGSVNQITVADWLKNSGEVTGTVKDFSKLSDITNVKGEETFDKSGNSMKWNTSGKDIYYQGKSEQELPVDVKITYSLDGKKMAAKDMLGKSGKAKIHVSYTNKSKQTKKVNGKEVTIYTPFVMVTGMILSSEHFSNVNVDNGRVINDGTNNIVVGLGMPGLAESLDLSDEFAEKIHSEFTVEADVTDFSIGNTFTYGSPSILEELNMEDAGDLDDLEDKLEELTDAASKLVDGSDTLSENMEKFADKMDELKGKMKEYQKDGVKKLTDGVNKLAKNGPALVKGVKDYTGGADKVANGTISYVTNTGKITQGCKTLYEQVKGLPAQIDTFSTGLNTYTGSVDKLGTKENVTAIKGGAKAVSDGISELNKNIGLLEQSIQASEAMVLQLEQKGADATVIGGLKQQIGAQKQIVAGLKAATGSDGALKKGAASLATGVNTVMDALSQLSSKSSELTKATGILKKNVPALVSAVKKLKDGGTTLSANDKKLISGAKALIKAGKTMRKSTKKMNSGMKALQKGSKKLNKATKQLVSGVNKLDNASGKLSDGASELASGMDEFNDKGVEKLNSTYEDDIKSILDRLDAVTEAGKDYKSFSGIGKGMDGEVKFVIETAAVEKEDE